MSGESPPAQESSIFFFQEQKDPGFPDGVWVKTPSYGRPKMARQAQVHLRTGEVTMKRVLTCVLSVAMLASAASAQDMVVFLSDNADGDNTIDLTLVPGPSNLGAIDLWMNVNASTRIIDLDIPLSGYDAGFSSNSVSFGVAGFIDLPALPGLMQRVSRGLGTSSISDYQYVAQDLNLPIDGNSGYLGTSLDILLDSIVIAGTSSNEFSGADNVIFGKASLGQAPAATLAVFSPFPPPGSWGTIPGVVGMGTGTSVNVMRGGFGPLLVNVTPEPASLALLAIGGFAALRRRR